VQIVTKAPVTVTLAVSGSNAVSGEVEPILTGRNSAISSPTGSVILYDGTAVVGTNTLGSTGGFTFSTSAFASGTHALTATYSGDNNFQTATTAKSLPITIPPAGTPDFSLAVDQTSGIVSRGGSWSTNVSMSSAYGFNGVVALSCGTMPQQMTCGFGSPSMTGQAKTVSTSMTFNTVATALQSMIGFVPLGVFFMRRKKRSLGSPLRVTAACLVLGCTLAGLTGCGSLIVYEQPNETPQGTYSVVVTGTSGALTHSQTVTITVQ
jgi:hypothetical protein